MDDQIDTIETGGVIEQGKVSWSDTQLDLPDDLAYDDWVSVGETLAHMDRSLMWWVGDWWRFGERRYGEAEAHAAQIGYNVQTVKNAAWVADRFPELSRRRDSLSFGHHEAVAALDPGDADALLDEAEPESGDDRPRLSQKKLREAVRRTKQTGQTTTPESSEPVPCDGDCDLLEGDHVWRVRSFHVHGANGLEPDEAITLRVRLRSEGHVHDGDTVTHDLAMVEVGEY